MAANGYVAGTSQQVVAKAAAQTIAAAGPTLRIVNHGPNVAYVAVGASNPVAVTPLTGLAIRPNGPPEFITASTYLGFCSEGQFPARLSVSNVT
jgi:hypothetical protein